MRKKVRRARSLSELGPKLPNCWRSSAASQHPSTFATAMIELGGLGSPLNSITPSVPSEATLARAKAETMSEEDVRAVDEARGAVVHVSTPFLLGVCSWEAPRRWGGGSEQGEGSGPDEPTRKELRPGPCCCYARARLVRGGNVIYSDAKLMLFSYRFIDVQPFRIIPRQGRFCRLASYFRTASDPGPSRSQVDNGRSERYVISWGYSC